MEFFKGKGGGQNLKDLALFGRVLSTGLVVAGYTFFGVYLSRWLEGRNWPDWLVAVTPAACAVFGIWQGWLFLSRAVKRPPKDDLKKH